MNDLKGKPFLFKSELTEMLGISARQLAKLMNETFYEELKAAGYVSKKSKLISPKVLRAFFHCYGKPLTAEDFIE